MKKINFVFWGSSRFSVICLNELKDQGTIPDLIITTPDMPTGRGLKLTPTPVKLWARENNIAVQSPVKLDSDFIKYLTNLKPDLSLVASYGKIIPGKILSIPKYQTLNIHPSYLPKYRGPAPLQTQILNNEKNIGVSIILLDEEVDHGPIIYQEHLVIPDWPIKFTELESRTASVGVRLFSNIIADWLAGTIIPQAQDHDQASFTKKIEKNDGWLDLEKDKPYQNWLKILAYDSWPQTYFFTQKGLTSIRVIIKEAEYVDNNLQIKKVLPEGKKEMNYEDFKRGLSSSIN